MSAQVTTNAVLVLVLLLNLGMLAVSRLAMGIRLFALQSLLLAFLPLAEEVLEAGQPGMHAYLIAAGTIALKVILIPYILLRILRTGEVHREVEPFIGFTASVFVGAMLVIGSFAVALRLPLPTPPVSKLIVPVALSTLLLGLLTLVSRLKAITQVLGFLVLENGVFILGLLLLKQTPLLVELGILLDLFVGVFIMAIVVYHIRREFDHMDTHLLDALKET
ncbi:MAG: hydrogenase [Phycisphaerae bacterium]|nr:hydrogenase [Phycisphaerae bacterium]NUQ46895.1 hydrogenase [Phycisphaerae bacterium]